MTGIQWTDETVNLVTGCNKISPGCRNCYAEVMTQRFPQTFPNGFQVTPHPERLEKLLKMRKPRRIFLNSMGDLFHEEVPLEFIQRCFYILGKTPQNTYQILTKRASRLLELAGYLDWHSNIWMGVSVELQQYAWRVDYLRAIPAGVRFLSCEPLLGPLELDLTEIDWVIVGGESGNASRPVHPDWVRRIQDQCIVSDIPFFFKQWGGRTPKAQGNNLDGTAWEEFPEAALSRHY